MLYDPRKIFLLVESHPDSSFCIFCENAVIMVFINEVTNSKNLMVGICYDESTETVCSALLERKLLNSIWYQYGLKDTESLSKAIYSLVRNSLSYIYCLDA